MAEGRDMARLNHAHANLRGESATPSEDEEGWFDIIEREDGDGCEAVPYQPRLLERCFASGGTISEPLLPGFAGARLFTYPALPSTLSADPELLVLQQEEETLGRWPRRLLHVPTMTSCEWTPGNIYAGVKEPLYNAISYTWGRWELPTSDVSTTALPVCNVPWAIPKVKPTCFSVGDFENALKAASAPQKDPTGLLIYEQVEFVWLDVACISQDKADPKSAAEVGRQAVIFEGAQIVFAWLHTLSQDKLRSYCEIVRAGSIHEKDDQRAISVFKSILALVGDPWFSSLWTLQEAFLRPDALLMSKGGTVVNMTIEVEAQQAYNVSEPGRKLVQWPAYTRDSTIDLLETVDNLVSLISGYALLQTGLQTIQPSSPGSHWAVKSKQALLEAGLLGLNSQNPLATYVAAEKRVVMRREDRVYAIQQIFRMRLGSTAVTRDSPIIPAVENEYSVSELQDQLGEQLLVKYPVLSQCHVFTEASPVGKAWRVNETSVMLSTPVETTQSWSYTDIYPTSPMVWANNKEACKALCRLDIHLQDGSVWGQFEGRMCRFNTFHKRVREHEDDGAMSRLYKASHTHTFLDIWLDKAAELDTLNPPLPNFTPCRAQRQLAERLAVELSSQLYVLILGVEFQQGEGGAEMLGTLMLKRSEASFDYWRRVGVCRWKRSHITTSEYIISERHRLRKEWFEGEGEEWVVVRGIFG